MDIGFTKDSMGTRQQAAGHNQGEISICIVSKKHLEIISLTFRSLLQLILSLLHHIASRGLLFFEDVLPNLAPLLIPFFAIKHPTSQRYILGPYSRISLDSQQLARGLGWYLASITGRDTCSDSSRALKDSMETINLLALN